MGLREFAGPRPFVVSAADGTRDRLAVEAGLRRRGRRAARSPAETGVLVVCGRPGEALAEAIEVVWAGMPGPRARVRPDALDDIVWDEGERARPSGEVEMAGRADDRDGLRLDVLHVPLGPVLADWPAGLRLDVALQGDVVQEARAVAVDAGGGSFWEGREAAGGLDGLARFLRVAGWDGAARRAAVLRDDLLDGRDVGARFGAFEKRVRRSALLRWMTRGVGVLTREAAERHGLAAWQVGDVHDRVAARLRQVGLALGGRDADRPSGASVAVLPALVEGAELARARLITASLDPDLAAVAADG